ncbi:hypothetical protein GGR57DRAFT_309906 [Xylariaceae sp. FL1272]|nr:hypothetical protein GGR57DRAFT_309906 [Xylariaceae sp. FL1272]
MRFSTIAAILSFGFLANAAPGSHDVTKRNNEKGKRCDKDSGGSAQGPLEPNVRKAALSLAERDVFSIGFGALGSCTVGDGPDACSLVQCGPLNVGIWLCNDNNGPINSAPSCGDIADYVNEIADDCTTDPGAEGHGHKWTAGEITDEGNWRVRVGWVDHC